jgi:peptidoglycan/LPS O-acetylase OafA/YrhL
MSSKPLPRLLFWAAAVVAFVMAVLPHPPQLPGAPSDKVQHILAFMTLAGLLAWAYPRSGFLKAALCLSAFGAVIECVQLIPALNRDGEALDWVADTCAAAITLAAAKMLRSRQRRSPSGLDRS